MERRDDDNVVRWFNYTQEELAESRTKQREVFAHMLAKLELRGECREVFHTLADVLVGDRLD